MVYPSDLFDLLPDYRGAYWLYCEDHHAPSFKNEPGSGIDPAPQLLVVASDQFALYREGIAYEDGVAQHAVATLVGDAVSSFSYPPLKAFESQKKSIFDFFLLSPIIVFEYPEVSTLSGVPYRLLVQPQQPALQLNYMDVLEWKSQIKTAGGTIRDLAWESAQRDEIPKVPAILLSHMDRSNIDTPQRLSSVMTIPGKPLFELSSYDRITLSCSPSQQEVELVFATMNRDWEVDGSRTIRFEESATVSTLTQAKWFVMTTQVLREGKLETTDSMTTFTLLGSIPFSESIDPVDLAAAKSEPWPAQSIAATYFPEVVEKFAQEERERAEKRRKAKPD